MNVITVLQKAKWIICVADFGLVLGIFNTVQPLGGA